MVTVGDRDLERASDVPVLVDRAKTMAPVLAQLARDRAGTALIAKLDTDRIPTLIAFAGRRAVAARPLTSYLFPLPCLSVP